jgi:hypothetical protein
MHMKKDKLTIHDFKNLEVKNTLVIKGGTDGSEPPPPPPPPIIVIDDQVGRG